MEESSSSPRAPLRGDAAAPVRVERRGKVGVLRIDRPPQRNALSREAIGLLGALGRELIADPSIGALVVTGAGNVAFSSGADLKERRGMSDDDVRAQLLLYRSEMAVLDASPKPVVAAINGLALGGGLELALACDLRVAAPHVELGLPETSLGIIPGAGGTQRLPRLVGEARAKELVLLGTRISAEVALAWGLINRISPPGVDVLEDTLQFIQPILDAAPLALAAALWAIDGAHATPLDRGLEVEREAYESVLGTEDRREALLAFGEKRRPTFVGR